jgi:arginyl-tRNA--protein-N-Asp/Glu arginylyltransferase
VTGDGEREPALRGLAAALDALALEPSEPSPCPYLPGRDARLVALRPEGFAPVLYRQFLDLNFRRLGDLVYRPQCDGCGECRELRVDAGRFRPTRAQRRCLKRNADVTAGSGRPVPTAEKHAVYQRYLEARHDGHMDGSFEEFSEFLHAGASFTREVVFRLGERLVGAGVYDVTPHALSAVYFYFDPELAARSPGTLNVLWLIEECRRRSAQWLYLGYHVAASPRMAYKAGFHPHERLEDGMWRRGRAPGGARMTA